MPKTCKNTFITEYYTLKKDRKCRKKETFLTWENTSIKIYLNDNKLKYKKDRVNSELH